MIKRVFTLLLAIFLPVFVDIDPVVDYKIERNNQELINCLMEHESSNGKYLEGDGGKAIGCLQYHYDTFKENCIEKHKLTDKDDRYDCKISQDCADKMIEDGLAYRWTTLSKCSELISKR